jgi:hypothetical protein
MMMEKNAYEMPWLQILSFDEQDVITASTGLDWRDQYDDKGTWNPDWFSGN